MRWLWFVGPMMVVVSALLLALRRTPEESRLREAMRKWMEQLAGPLRLGNKTRARRVKRLQAGFEHMVELAGGGARISDAVLLPKMAYVAARAASSAAGSQHVTVIAKMASAGPKFQLRPLPIYDGAPAENTGIRFSKDPGFMEEFVVEGQNAKAIGKWLKPTLRDALLDLPDVWLQVHGHYFAVTLYGNHDADTLDELVSVADALFSEHGVDPDESLLGDGGASDVRANAKASRANKNDSAKKKPTPANAQLRLYSAAVDVGLYLVGLAGLVFVLGHLGGMHPAALFNSPDPIVTEPWQGGWTTKGVGALVAVEAFLAGILLLQSYLASTSGQSIGKYLFGARIERLDGKPLDFMRAVFLRHWVWAALPLLAAASRAKPFGARALFEQMPSLSTIGTAALLVMLMVGSALAAGARGLHDRIAGTQVVMTEPAKLVWLQLGERSGNDPIVAGRVRMLGVLLLVTAGLSVAYLSGVGFWIF